MKIHPSIDHARETFWALVCVGIFLATLCACTAMVLDAYRP